MRIKDQLGRQLEFENTPSRIISVVPSFTELLYDINIKPIAQTIFCIKPELEFKDAVKIGGTKKLKIDKIKALNPDLVIANKEENLKEEIEAIAEFCPVYLSDISTIKDAEEMMESIGLILDRQKEIRVLLEKIRMAKAELQNTSKGNYLYFIWQKPFFVAGMDTFISQMLAAAGYKNCIDMNRYPEISEEEIIKLNPDYLFLSSEPFPFKEKHRTEIQKRFPQIEVKLIDGEMISWYGSRMVEGFKYLADY